MLHGNSLGESWFLLSPARAVKEPECVEVGGLFEALYPNVLV